MLPSLPPGSIWVGWIGNCYVVFLGKAYSVSVTYWGLGGKGWALFYRKYALWDCGDSSVYQVFAHKHLNLSQVPWSQALWHVLIILLLRRTQNDSCDLWGVLASQPNWISKAQASKLPQLKIQGEMFLETSLEVVLQPPHSYIHMCACALTHMCTPLTAVLSLTPSSTVLRCTRSYCDIDFPKPIPPVPKYTLTTAKLQRCPSLQQSYFSLTKVTQHGWSLLWWVLKK